MAAEAEEPGVTGIKDAGEYNQRRRIKLILDAVSRFFEQRRTAKDLMLSGQIDQELAADMVRDAVEEYVYLSENKIKEYLPKENEFSYDNLTDEQQLAVDVWWQTPLGGVEMVTDSVDIVGLHGYIDAPDEFVDEWTESEQSAVHGTVGKTRTEVFHLPMDVSERAFRVLNFFWSSLGMDVQMDTETHQTEITDEMLEEVKEWRKQNR